MGAKSLRQPSMRTTRFWFEIFLFIARKSVWWTYCINLQWEIAPDGWRLCWSTWRKVSSSAPNGLILHCAVVLLQGLNLLQTQQAQKEEELQPNLRLSTTKSLTFFWRPFAETKMKWMTILKFLSIHVPMT